jgi:hypothetical protein
VNDVPRVSATHYIPITTIPDEHSKVRFKRVVKYITFPIEYDVTPKMQEYRRLTDRSVTVHTVFPLCESRVELALMRRKK